MSTDQNEPTTNESTGGRVMAKGLALAALAIGMVAAITVVVALGMGSSSGERRASQTFSYVVPAGTGADVERGNVRTDLFPDYLEVQVGDTITIDNRDDRTHILGPFSVRPGEQFRYEFVETGTYRGACTVHGDGHEAVVRVLDAIAPAVA
jgi:plastocyanin